MARFFVLVCVTFTAMPLLTGCYMTMEQRWEALDVQRRQEIGRENERILSERMGLAKRTKSPDGEDVWTWEFSGMAAPKVGGRP